MALPTLPTKNEVIDRIQSALDGLRTPDVPDASALQGTYMNVITGIAGKLGLSNPFPNISLPFPLPSLPSVLPALPALPKDVLPFKLPFNLPF